METTKRPTMRAIGAMIADAAAQFASAAVSAAQFASAAVSFAHRYGSRGRLFNPGGITGAGNPDGYGSYCSSPPGRNQRRKRLQRIRRAHGGKLPKRYR